MEKLGSAEMELPGFRFHPTEEELLDFYLKRVVQGKKLQFDIIPTVHLYRHHPWELPGLARIGEREWYFFVPRDRKQANGGRPSRTTEHGFWKATGSDRPVRSVVDPKRLIGLKKTLVYYEGRAPRGTKTDWVMNEYRLPECNSSSGSPPKEDIVLCKIYRKAISLKELEQRVAMEETKCSHNSDSPIDSFSSSDHDPVQNWMFVEDAMSVLSEETKQKEIEEEVVNLEEETVAQSLGKELNLPELELPKFNELEWMQDPFLTQLRSPWMDQCLKNQDLDWIKQFLSEYGANLSDKPKDAPDMEFILGNCEVKDEDTSSLLVHSEFAESSSNIEAKTESIDQNSTNSDSITNNQTKNALDKVHEQPCMTTATNSISTRSHEKATIHIMAQRKRTAEMQLSEIAKYFHLPLLEAAKELQICTSSLKAICRKHGITRWPQRKIRAMDIRIVNLKKNLKSQSSKSKIANRIKTEIKWLEEKRAAICSGVQRPLIKDQQHDGHERRWEWASTN